MVKKINLENDDNSMTPITKAVKHYTAEGYTDINRFLIHKKGDIHSAVGKQEQVLQKNIEYIDEAFRKYGETAEKEFTVYRGIMSKRHKPRKPDKDILLYNYLSTSATYDAACLFTGECNLMEQYTVRPGTVFLNLGGNENEILFPRNCRLRLTDKPCEYYLQEFRQYVPVEQECQHLELFQE